MLELGATGSTRRVDLDLRDVTRRTVALLAPEADGCDVRFALSLDAVPVLVQGDAAALDWLAINLLKHAVEADDAGSTVEVVVDRTPRLCVCNVGEAIASDRITEIFEPFATNEPHGTGLGLAIALEIAAWHDATLAVTNGDRTTTFMLHFTPRAGDDDMTDAPIILIVEDDAGARRALGELLEADGFVVREAATLAAAREASAAPDVSAILLDLRLPDGNGQELLVERGAGHVPIIVMTAFGSGSRAIEAMRAGAYDYVQKPLDPDEIGPTLRRALDHARLTSELARAQRHVDAPIAAAERIVGTSTALQRVFKLIGRVAQSDATVLISGESGTGKELVASVIHAYSARESGPFVAINCAAVPEALLESEFFGYEKGAFTNAMVQRIGRFEAAAGGTLFLDEIGELPLAMQAKLLRFIQKRTIERLGGNTSIKIDTRIITASNRDLHAEVEAGRFREDLYYRPGVVEIALPPLRDRLDDIPALVDYFLARAMRRSGQRVAISEAALRELAMRPWRGNVRELENTIERAIVLSRGTIDLENLAPFDVDERAYRAFVASLEREALDANDPDLAARIGVSGAFLARRREELER